MAWIQIHQQLKDHRKVLAAADELDIEPAHMLGLLISFWLFSDLERMKGADVVEVMALGRNFMLKSEPEPQENDSAEPTATTPESTTPARQSSKKSE